MILTMSRTLGIILGLAVMLASQVPPRHKYQEACLNVAQLEQLGTQPLAQYLGSIAALQNPHQVALAVGALHRYGAFAAFRVGQEPVPDRLRDYATQSYAQKLFELLGDPAQEAAEEARTAINMEVSLTPPPAAAPPRALHLAELRRLAPNFDWHAYWATLGAPENGTLAASPDALRQLNGRILLATMEEWKSYLRWCWLRATAALLTPPFVEAHFGFATAHPAPARPALCTAAAAAFPATAFADVPLTRDDYFGDTLHLRAWKVRQRWLRGAVVNSTSALTPSGAAPSTPSRGR